ncbi:MAG: hypothetical protein ABJ056_01130 [Halioglobus sp.]
MSRPKRRRSNEELKHAHAGTIEEGTRVFGLGQTAMRQFVVDNGIPIHLGRFSFSRARRILDGEESAA